MQARTVSSGAHPGAKSGALWMGGYVASGCPAALATRAKMAASGTPIVRAATRLQASGGPGWF